MGVATKDQSGWHRYRVIEKKTGKVLIEDALRSEVAAFLGVKPNRISNIMCDQKNGKVGRYKLELTREAKRTRIGEQAWFKKMLYTVYRKATDELVVLDATKEEAAMAMGISPKSFARTFHDSKLGLANKWHIESRCADEDQEEV